MNTDLISNATRATLEGSMPFPEIVGQLIVAGVEFYHADYSAMQMTFYSDEGATVSTPILFEDMPLIPSRLDVAALKANIIDSQQNGQDFRGFTHRAMQAGVQSYFAFLKGRRVTYLGRLGDQHTEWFPGAKPSDA